MISLLLLSTENWDILRFMGSSKSWMAQNWWKTDISELVSASHDPLVREIVIFVHHAYSPHLLRLLSYALWLLMPKLCIGKGKLQSTAQQRTYLG